MSGFKSHLVRLAHGGVWLSVVAQAQFVEPDVEVLATLPIGTAGSGSFGWAVADMADIDGDGVRDAIVGALNAGGGAGNVWVFSGQSGGQIWRFVGGAGRRIGHAVADAGDVDNDGVNDIVAGGIIGSGLAIVYSGSTGAILHNLVGESDGDAFGYAVAGAGDLNDDGHAEVAVGAERNDTLGADSGRVYIYSGADGSLLRAINAPAASIHFGSGLGACGDLNGDGLGELIVGARTGPTAGGRGAAFVISGADGSLLLPTLLPDATAGSAGQFFVAGAGDVNADETPDLYMGDFADNAIGGGSGKAYVYSGSDGRRLHTFSASTPGEGLGCGRGAGDVNLDGHADLIIGSYTFGGGAAGAGRVTIFSGRDGTVLRTITSTTGGEQLGFDAVGIGDLNADGEVDFLVAGTGRNRAHLIAGEATCATDVDGNQVVDLADLTRLLSAFGAATGDPGFDGSSDINGDGLVDLADLTLVLASFGTECP